MEGSSLCLEDVNIDVTQAVLGLQSSTVFLNWPSELWGYSYAPPARPHWPYVLRIKSGTS